MDAGYIPLNRNFFDHHLWQEDRVFSRAEAWLDLIREAAWKEIKKIIAGKLIEVPRGGIVASVRFLSDRWKWSNTKVCQFLELLRLDGMITTEKRQGVTVILLVNFERFNPSSNVEEKPRKRQRNDAEATEKRQRNDETEEGKEGKEEPNGSSEREYERPSLSEFFAHVTGHLRRSQQDAEHVWNVYEENGWTRAQAGKRVPIKYWRKALSTWETGGHFPSQRGVGSPRAVPLNGHQAAASPKPAHELTIQPF